MHSKILSGIPRTLPSDKKICWHTNGCEGGSLHQILDVKVGRNHSGLCAVSLKRGNLPPRFLQADTFTA
jgi:hypothetical protein